MAVYLYHYYEAANGPFRNLSDLAPAEAEFIQARLRAEGKSFASRRAVDYLAIRRELEQRVRRLFIAKGGNPQRACPHYMIVGPSDWLKGWYQSGCELHFALEAFAPDVLSFTYGDTFPAMRYQDGKPYRAQVYTVAELPGLIETYGLPQDWNAEGKLGPDRYIEAQVWADGPLQAYLPKGL
jgi:hypothetical protein